MPRQLEGAITPTAVLRCRRIIDQTILLVRYAPFQRLASHAHEQDSITVLLQGEMAEETPRANHHAAAGWAGIRPRGMAHANRYGPRGAILVGIMPDAETFDRLPCGWRGTESALAYRAGLRLLRDDNGGSEDSIAELLAELLPLRRRQVDSRLAAHARTLVDDPDRDATVSAIARELDVHPVYLARQFRETYGSSIRDYRTIQNVRRAADALLSSRKPLSQIAHEIGFSDHSHMCRAFRRVAGWHPSTLRK